MNDSDGPRETHNSRYYDKPTWWARFVADLQRRADKRSARKKQESAADRAARRTAVATVFIAIFTLATVAVGISQFFVFQGQLGAMQGQLKSMRDAAPDTTKLVQANQALANAASIQAGETQQLVAANENLASAAKIQASNSGKLVDVTNKSASAAIKLVGTEQAANKINQQGISARQAFMIPVGVNLEKIINTPLTHDLTGTKPAGWIATVKWQNSGGTPTRDLKITTYCLFSMERIDDPETIKASDPKKGQALIGQETETVFGPGEIDRGSECPLNGLVVMLHEMFSMPFYIFGTATYRDIFDEAYVHRTKFCYQVLLSGNIETGWLDEPKIAPLASDSYRCIKHNCADAECDRQDKDDAALSTDSKVALPTPSTKKRP